MSARLRAFSDSESPRAVASCRAAVWNRNVGDVAAKNRATIARSGGRSAAVHERGDSHVQETQEQDFGTNAAQAHMVKLSRHGGQRTPGTLPIPPVVRISLRHAAGIENSQARQPRTKHTEGHRDPVVVVSLDFHDFGSRWIRR